MLGPSSIFAARRLADWLEGQPSGIEIALADLGHSLGLGGGTARHAPIVRTLGRLIVFGVAAIAWDTYALSRTFPLLSPHQRCRLPSYLAERHDHDAHRFASELTAARVAPLR